MKYLNLRSLLLSLLLLTSCNDGAQFSPPRASSPPPIDRIEDSIISGDCGLRLEENYRLASNLNCSQSTGHAAYWIDGGSVVFDGNNKELILGLTNEAGLVVQGETVVIKNLTIRGYAHQIGILGHNVKNLILENVKIEELKEGVVYSADLSFSCENFKILNSEISKNELHAVRVTANHCAKVKEIKNSKFYQNKFYALNINAKEFSLSSRDEVELTGSLNGINLNIRDTAYIQEYNFKDQLIEGEELTVSFTKNLLVQDCLFGGSYAAIGINIYESEDIVLEGNTFFTKDFALKVSNEQIETSLRIVNNVFKPQGTAAVILSSYGAFEFQKIRIENNDWTSNILSVVDYSQCSDRTIEL